MKIYTKGGDAGETGLYGGKRISKTSLRIAAVGDVDELNAALGIARSWLSVDRQSPLSQSGSSLREGAGGGRSSLLNDLSQIQSWLFELGGELGTPAGNRVDNATLSDAATEYLERSIDDQTSALEPLKSFILPGGHPAAAQLHFARCVCRRAERSVLLLHEHEPVRDVALRFLNRLSDWIFTAARTANRLASVEDVKWQK